MNSRTKNFLFLWWIGIFCGVAVQASAQTPAPSPPPLPRFPEGDVAYSVGVTSRAAPSPASANDSPQGGNTPHKTIPLQMTGARVTCINHSVRYQIAWSGGASSEHWMDAKLGLDLSQDVRSKTVFLSPSQSSPGSFTSLLGPMNSLFSSVGASNLTGRETLNGKTCLHYKWTVAVPPAPMNYQAWVDEKTGVLVAVVDNLALYTFAFDPAPPTGPLVMPPEFKARLSRYLELTRPVQHL